MKKRVILFSAILMLALLTLTGCGNKKAISVDDFKSLAKEANLKIIDATDEFKNYKHIKSATAAKSNDDWQVEFYVLNNDENAKGMFNTNKTIFESSKSGLSSNKSVSLNNYESFSLKTSGYFKYVARIDNTVVYANIKEEYANSAKEFIKKLGY